MTRLKKNTPFNVVAETHVSKSSNVVGDRIGPLPARLANSRKNPLQVPVREIRVIIENG
ncbi:IS4 family transposase, partial [Bradyrhizobium forestalis]